MVIEIYANTGLKIVESIEWLRKYIELTGKHCSSIYTALLIWGVRK
jgi:hypothetical protein